MRTGEGGLVDILSEQGDAEIEVEVVVGSDGIIRINVDDECRLRVRLGPKAEFRVRDERKRADIHALLSQIDREFASYHAGYYAGEDPAEIVERLYVKIGELRDALWHEGSRGRTVD
jgi:hypothetical protein